VSSTLVSRFVISSISSLDARGLGAHPAELTARHHPASMVACAGSKLLGYSRAVLSRPVCPRFRWAALASSSIWGRYCLAIVCADVWILAALRRWSGRSARLVLVVPILGIVTSLYLVYTLPRLTKEVVFVALSACHLLHLQHPQ
jgi:hypothetical protein